MDCAAMCTVVALSLLSAAHVFTLMEENRELRLQLAGAGVEEPSAVKTLRSNDEWFHMVVFVSLVGGALYKGRRVVGALLRGSRSGSARSVRAQHDRNEDGNGNGRPAREAAKLDFSRRELLFYQMDYFLSSYNSAKPMALLGATYVLIFVGGFLFQIYHDESLSLGEAMWIIWTFVADPGTHADQERPTLRTIAFLATIGGMLIFALMIGIVADAVSDSLDELKKGKSRVIESGHTLVLGWSDKALPTIREIAIANESEGGGVCVVLAERPKQAMEQELALSLSKQDLRGTIVVFRSGSPILMSELLKVSAPTAKSVIVLADQSAGADESDARAVRVVMSLTGIHVKSHVVVEMCDIDNRELVHLVGRGMVETIVAHDIIGRLMIQCARQPGLAQILEQLLGFDDNEFYIEQWPCLTGKTFQAASFLFKDAIPIGIKPADYNKAYNAINRRRVTDPSDDRPDVSYMDISSSAPYGEDSNRTILNPPGSYVIQPGDAIVVLAEDDDTYEASSDWPSKTAASAHKACNMQHAAHGELQVEKLLFCGWRRDMDDMIKELDKIVAQGSELTIMCTVPEEERLRRLNEPCKVDVRNLRNLCLKHEVGNPVLRRHLQKVDLVGFDSILILADEAVESNMQTADSRSLAALLLIRDEMEKRMNRRPVSPRKRPQGAKKRQKKNDARISRASTTEEEIKADPEDIQAVAEGNAETPRKAVIISEILDSRTKSLIAVAEVSDYVMSNELVAMTLAMVAEDRSINYVLSELLSSQGNEIAVRSIMKYCGQDTELSFWEIMARARRGGEIALGYKAYDAQDAVLNPPMKGKKRKWNERDLVVVLTHI